MSYIGIDPGKNGGIAWISSGWNGVNVIKMPHTEKGIAELFKEMSGLGELLDMYACLEEVHSMPRQGVSSTFKFGTNYGFLRACLTIYNIPFETVTPQIWQREFIHTVSETKTEHKNKLKAVAQQLFPGQKATLATADALLLAEYCRRKYQNK